MFLKIYRRVLTRNLTASWCRLHLRLHSSLWGLTPSEKQGARAPTSAGEVAGRRLIPCSPKRKRGCFSFLLRGLVGCYKMYLPPHNCSNSYLCNIPVCTVLGPFFGPIYYIEEDFSFNLRKIEILNFFSPRGETPDNHVLLTKCWKRAVVHFSREDDGGGKMAHTISHFLPSRHLSSTKDFLRFSL